jgi:hypothetical protein
MSLTINNESFTITNNGKSFEILKDNASLDRNSERVYMNGFWWDLEKATADGYVSLDDLYNTLRDKIDHRYTGDGGGAYIPLSGTEVGSPVTGPISLYSVANDYNYNVSAGDDFSVYTDDDYNGFGMNKQGIVFNFTGLNSRGLDGAAYYGENYGDNTYVQKKYVDAVSPSVFGHTTLSGGTIVVANTDILSTSIIIITGNGNTNAGFLSVTKNAGVGFTIDSSNLLDNRTVDYIIKY